MLHKPSPLRRRPYVERITLSDDTCERCGGSIRKGTEPQRIVQIAVAGRLRTALGEWLALEDAGLCSNRCRDSMERPIITAVLPRVVG